jgi:hypothetical protein
MNLTERLELARRKRLVEAGLLPADQLRVPATPAAPEPDPSPLLFQPMVMEALPPSGPHVVVTPIHRESDVAIDLGDGGEPEPPCPNCGTTARVDMVDLVGHRSHYSCPNCHAMWQVVSAD